MILTCPACGTQYVVKDGAIPEGGRKVRCAACRHSWHQDAPPLELEEAVEPEQPLEPQQAIEPEQPIEAEEPPSVDDHRQGDVATDEGYAPIDPALSPDADRDDLDEARDGSFTAPAVPTDAMAGTDAAEEEATDRSATAFSDPADDVSVAPPGEDVDEPRPAPPADVDDEFSPFAARGPAERKGRSPLAVAALIVLLVAALAAAFWFLAPPAWKARVGLADAGKTPLQLMMTHSDRQALASGNELLAVSGRVINPTTKTQRVPPIRAELRGGNGKVVYRWTIDPPTQTLAPGASARFNSAEVNVPAGGEELTVSLGAPTS